MKQRVDYDGSPGRGIIYLLDFNDRQVKSAHYSGCKQRNDIINQWRREYAKAFNDCSIQIAPGFKEDNVNEHGFNTKFQQRRDWHDGVKTTSIKKTGWKATLLYEEHR